MEKWTQIAKNLSLLTQLGLSLVIPLVLCLLVCRWLCERFGLGMWVYIPGFILGLGSFAVTAWKVYLSQMRKREQEEKGKKKKVSFNRHI